MHAEAAEAAPLSLRAAAKRLGASHGELARWLDQYPDRLPSLTLPVLDAFKAWKVGRVTATSFAKRLNLDRRGVARDHADARGEDKCWSEEYVAGIEAELDQYWLGLDQIAQTAGSKVSIALMRQSPFPYRIKSTARPGWRGTIHGYGYYVWRDEDATAIVEWVKGQTTYKGEQFLANVLGLDLEPLVALRRMGWGRIPAPTSSRNGIPRWRLAALIPWLESLGTDVAAGFRAVLKKQGLLLEYIDRFELSLARAEIDRRQPPSRDERLRRRRDGDALRRLGYGPRQLAEYDRSAA